MKQKLGRSNSRVLGSFRTLGNKYAKAAAAITVSAALAMGSACGGRSGLPALGNGGHDAGTNTTHDGGDAGHSDGGHGDGGHNDGGSDGGSPPVYDSVHLIGDYLNRRIGDREDNLLGDSDSAYSIGGSDTSGTANPFTNGSGGTIGPTEEFMFKIDSSQFAQMADNAVADTISGNSYLEKQALWINGDNHFDGMADDVVGRLNFVAYSMKFDGPGAEELGIPLCPSSPCNPNQSTPANRVAIQFGGHEWFITSMTPPDSATAVVTNGGSVSLAKEAAYGHLSSGDVIESDGLKFRLDAVSDQGGVHKAVISVLDSNDDIIQTSSIDPTTTTVFDIGGTQYPIHVYRTDLAAAEADVALLSEELVLSDGASMPGNPDYEVALGWKGAGTPEHLRTIVLWTNDIEDISSNFDNELEAGDYIPIPSAWRLSYHGLSITSSERHSLEFEIRTSDKLISGSKGPLFDGMQASCTIRAPYIRVSSGEYGSVFESGRDDAVGAVSDDEFIITLANGSACDADQNGTPELEISPYAIFMNVSPASDDYGYSVSGTVDYFGIDGRVRVHPRTSVESGDELGNLVESDFGDAVCASAECADVYISISEDSGAGTSNYWIFGASNTTSLTGATFDFDSSTSVGYPLTSNNEEVLYGHAVQGDYTNPSGPVSQGMESVEEGYISERGSTFELINNTAVTFDMAHVLATCTWTVTSE